MTARKRLFACWGVYLNNGRYDLAHIVIEEADGLRKTSCEVALTTWRNIVNYLGVTVACPACRATLDDTRSSRGWIHGDGMTHVVRPLLVVDVVNGELATGMTRKVWLACHDDVVHGEVIDARGPVDCLACLASKETP